jgi:hypothetical protein
MMFSRPADCGARLHPSLVRRHDWLFWRDCAPQSADLLDITPALASEAICGGQSR